MFFKTKKIIKGNCNTKLSRHLINHLNAVDEVYMKTFAIKSVRALQDYVSRECAVKVGQSAFTIGSRYFGADKFRTTKWTLLKEEGSVLTVCKSVVFDKVRVGGSMQIGVAENYNEVWVIDNTFKRKPIVLDIAALKEI